MTGDAQQSKIKLVAEMIPCLLIVASAITWPIYLIISAVLWLIGWPVCAWLVWRGRYRSAFVTRYGRTLLEWIPGGAWLWGNDEDGIDGLRGGDIAQHRWMKQTAGMNSKRRILLWSCNRNPIGNLRFARAFGFIIRPSRVRWIGNSFDPATESKQSNRKRILWHFVWHGIYTGLWLTVGKIQIRIGWKLKPADTIAVTDYRAQGCGFALQYRKVDP